MTDHGLQGMGDREFNKNKPGNFEKIARQRLQRYIITDHYSGAIYLEYRLGHETQENLIETFLHAITRRDGEAMHGVPLHLLMDKGAANIAHQARALLATLTVQLLTHEAGNSRAKGQVEVHQNIVERDFEFAHRFRDVHNLAELNDRARQWAIAFNVLRPHTRHGKSRQDMWLTIAPEQLRLAPPPEILRELVVGKEQKATVRPDLTIRHKIKGQPSRFYDVRHVPGIVIRQPVIFRINPYRLPCLDVKAATPDGADLWITVEPVATDHAGFHADAATIGQEYKGVPDTATDQARKRLIQLSYAANTEQEAEQSRNRKQPIFQETINPYADIEQAILPIPFPRRGAALPCQPPARQAARINAVDAALRLRTLLGRSLTDQEYQHLTSGFPDGITEEELAALQTAPRQPAGQRPALAVVGG